MPGADGLIVSTVIWRVAGALAVCAALVCTTEMSSAPCPIRLTKLELRVTLQVVPTTVASTAVPPKLTLTVAPSSLLPLSTVFCSSKLMTSSPATRSIVGGKGVLVLMTMLRLSPRLNPSGRSCAAMSVGVPSTSVTVPRVKLVTVRSELLRLLGTG